MKVTFIGLGIMGSRMAANLLKSNVDLTVYNRTKAKRAQLHRLGAKTANTPQESVAEADVVFTMLSEPGVVRKLADQFLPAMRSNGIWIDCSTVSPLDTLESKEQANNAGIHFLEAPVAGTKQPAEAGELVFFVGGDKEDFDQIETLLSIMGKKSVFMGEHGKAASIKLLINLMLAQSMLAFSEAVLLGSGLGLDEHLVHDILLNVPVTAPFLQKIRTKLEQKDQTANFPLQWMVKDLGIVRKMSGLNKIQLESFNIAEEIYQSALSSGMENHDFSSIYHFIKRELTTQ